MSAWAFILDPTADDASATQLALSLSGNVGYSLAGYDLSPPPLKAQYATGASMNGGRKVEAHYENRQTQLTYRVYGSTHADLANKIQALGMKAAKINAADGKGVIGITNPAGTAYFLDVSEMSVSPASIPPRVTRCVVTLDFVGRPFAREAEVTSLSAHPETSAKALVFTETGIRGDVPGKGRLVITDAQGVDQRWAVWGVQSEHYDSAATAKLFYEAEALTPLGTAAIATVSGASGGGSNNVLTEGTLTPNWAPVLSTQILSGSAHMTHVGSFRPLFRVYRPTTNTGAVSIRFDWAIGDFVRTVTGDVVSWDADELEGVFTIADLGIITIPKAVAGSQRWQGRLLAKSTIAGDDLSVDCVGFIPVDEGSGEATAVQLFEAPSSYSARDEFNQSAGNLTGGEVAITAATNASPIVVTATSHGLSNGQKVWIEGVLGNTAANGYWTVASAAANTFALTGSTGNGAYTSGGKVYKPGKALPAGGDWHGVGDTDDATIDTSGHTAQRATTSDTGSIGRVFIAGSPSLTATAVQVDAKLDSYSLISNPLTGVFARYVNSSNFMYAVIGVTSTGRYYVSVGKWIAGTETTLWDNFSDPISAFAANSFRTIRLLVDALGRWYVWFYPQGGTPVQIANGQDSDLATGGTLATGKVGISDETGSGTITRSYDNFIAFAATGDAVFYASQSMEIRDNAVIREDSSGTIWGGVADYEGDYFTVPPAAVEARTLRVIVMDSRNEPGTMGDTGVDDLTGQVLYTPQYLNLPPGS